MKYQKGDIYSDRIFFEFAIYFFDDNNNDLNKIKDFILENYNEFQIVEKPNKNVKDTQLRIIQIDDVSTKYRPPDIGYLDYFGRGLSSEQKQRLQNVEKAYIFGFYCYKEGIWNIEKRACNLIYSMSNDIDGIIWDETTRECFTKEFWKEKRIDLWTDSIPDISNHIVMHFYKEGEFYRLVTLGMSKFGLPDIVIDKISSHIGESVGGLINLTCQTLCERGYIDEEGKLLVDIDRLKNEDLKNLLYKTLQENAQKKAILNIFIGKNEKGDPDNILLEIRFGEITKRNCQVELTELMDNIFGSKDDEVISVQHDKEILKASKRAKEKLPELKKKFNEGFEPGEYILLKLPFTYGDDNNEWMWIEVIKWEKKKIIGILQNDPYYIENLKAGAEVNGKEKDVFDYIHYFSDGKNEGNETGKIMQKMSNK